MNGILIYTPEDAAKNTWFIQQMQQEGARRGHMIHLWVTNPGKPLPMDVPIDFCINRSRNAGFSRALEEMGVPCINPSETIRIANDKWETFLLLRKLSLPCMDTFLPENPPSFPFVVKSLAGHGGSQVFLVHNEKEYAAVQAQLQTLPYLLQPLCDEPGVDVRAYCMGEKVIAAVKRTSAADFRSNFSLGGQVALFTPEPCQLDCIRALQKALQWDYVGVDFIRHNGQWVVNEIEDAAGARMLYRLADIPFIPLFWDQIETHLR